MASQNLSCQSLVATLVAALWVVLAGTQKSRYANVRVAVSACHTELGGQVRAVQIIPGRNLYRQLQS